VKKLEEQPRRGKHIVDLLIDATASIHRLTLATYNQDHFPMEDINIYDPMPEL